MRWLIFLGPPREKNWASHDVNWGFIRHWRSDGENQYVRVSGKYSVAKLIGALPGYVGDKAGDYLMEFRRWSSYSTILWNGIEKAFSSTFNIFYKY
jgi:hypothetical protein